jgi:hexosaminidase
MVPNALFVAFVALLAAPLGVHSLWPIPRTLSSGSEGLKLAHGFAIQFQGSLSHHAPADLKAAVSRTLYQLKHDGLERLVIGRAGADTEKIAKARQLNVLKVELVASASNNIPGITQNANLPIGMRDEAYTLHVPADGSPSVLTANSTLGLFRGLTTFSQLWYTSGSTIYTVEAPITIWDKPAYVRVNILGSSLDAC